MTKFFLSPYNLGWHIDNVMIGSEQKDYQASSEEMQTAGSLKGKARQAMGFGLIDSLTGYHDQMAVVRAAVVTDGTSDNSSGIPFRAKITVESSAYTPMPLKYRHQCASRRSRTSSG